MNAVQGGLQLQTKSFTRIWTRLAGKRIHRIDDRHPVQPPHSRCNRPLTSHLGDVGSRNSSKGSTDS